MMIGKMHIWLFVLMCLAHQLDAASTLVLDDRLQLDGESKKESSPLSQAQLNKECGANSIGGKWSGRDFPWMAFISSFENPYEVNCGGALISEQYVLTAAQCVIDATTGLGWPGKHFKVHLGTYDISVNVTLVDYEVSEVVFHPKFNSTIYENDIGLLRLVKPVEFGVSIAPICLPTVSQVIEVGTKPTIAGWGAVEVNGKPVTRLRFTGINSISTADCQMVVGTTRYALSDSQLCGDHSGDGKGACHDDEGGPLMVPNAEGRATAFGIISTVHCGRPGWGDTFTKVNSHLDWIKKNAKIQ